MTADISKLLQLEHNCKNCENEKALNFIIVNETRQLVDYDQAVLLGYEFSSKLKVLAISDMAVLDSTSLHLSFVEDLANHLINQKQIASATKSYEVNITNDLNQTLQEELREFSPPNILWIPMKISKNNIELEYYLILFKVYPFEQKEIEVLDYIASSYKFFLFAMRKCSFGSKLSTFKFKSKYLLLVAALIVAAMFYPIKMNVVAPFEIEAKNPFIVTSPIDAIVDEIKVEQNQQVSKNILLVQLEDIDLKNSVDIAAKKLEAARAQLYSAKQASFFEREKLSQIPGLQKEIMLKQSELSFAVSQLKKTKIYASKDGIAIIENPNSFKGKPVSTGEKIMLIADSNDIQIKIMVPVSDALFLQESADVKLTFDNKVLDEWDAKIKNISYNPELTEQNILSYKVTANFNDLTQHKDVVQIGLRGTAKIYSKDVTLFFYLFRKPITYLRQTGIW